MSEGEGEAPLEGTPRIIGRDEMFTVYRIEHPGGDNGLPCESYSNALALRFTIIEIYFHARGAPPLRGRIEVYGPDGNDWTRISEEDEARLQSIWPETRTEFDVPSPHWYGRSFKAERGLDFIRRRVEYGTPEYWLAEEAYAIRKVLDDPTPDAALWAAHALGELRTRARHHGLHLAALTTGYKQRRILDGHRTRAVQKARAPAAARRDAVAMMLAETKLTGGALEEYLIRRLHDEHGIEASPRTIRRDVASLRSGRPKKSGQPG